MKDITGTVERNNEKKTKFYIDHTMTWYLQFFLTCNERHKQWKERMRRQLLACLWTELNKWIILLCYSRSGCLVETHASTHIFLHFINVSRH